MDYFQTCPPTASPAAIRLMAFLAYTLGPQLRHFDVEQAFVQSDLDTKIHMRLPPGCGSMSGQVVSLTNRSMA